MCDNHTKSVTESVENKGKIGAQFGFPELIKKYMQREGLSRNELARRIGRSPEHVRKLETGRAFPGEDLQQKLTAVLRMSDDEAADFNATIKLDHWIDWFGDPPQADTDPSMPQYWTRLTSKQKATLKCLAECLLREADQV